ncbi:MAG: tetratricopeptide repeat protein [Ktedonobacterales bacterium]|nr:tetratricopeptide repeat protein [Ktedonobacterales bacterium]
MSIPTPSAFDALWDYDHPQATEERFRELLPELTATGNLDATLQLLTQIARAQGLQGRFTDAQATLNQVQAQLSEATPEAQVRLHLERGRAANSAGQPAAACDSFRAAYALANALHRDFYTIDALHMLAIADAPERQMDWNQQALTLAQQSSDPRAANWQASLYNNLGWGYFDANDYAQALANFEQALRCREQRGQVRETLIARWCIARTLRALGRTAEALQRQQEIRAAWLAAGEEPDGYGSEEIAENLWEMGQGEAARPYFAEAYARFAANGTLADQPERLARIKERANLAE